MWYSVNRQRLTLRRGEAARPRRGGITLELILVFPVWFILLGAIVEFGQILVNHQQIVLASRVGAEEASQTPLLPTAGDVPQNVLDAIDHQLASAGISRCQVILEHDVGLPTSRSPAMLTEGQCDCDPPAAPLPSISDSTSQSVRVTVCVELTEITPNLLWLFGFDVADKRIQSSTTFRYEL